MREEELASVGRSSSPAWGEDELAGVGEDELASGQIHAGKQTGVFGWTECYGTKKIRPLVVYFESSTN